MRWRCRLEDKHDRTHTWRIRGLYECMQRPFSDDIRVFTFELRYAARCRFRGTRCDAQAFLTADVRYVTDGPAAQRPASHPVIVRSAKRFACIAKRPASPAGRSRGGRQGEVVRRPKRWTAFNSSCEDRFRANQPLVRGRGWEAWPHARTSRPPKKIGCGRGSPQPSGTEREGSAQRERGKCVGLRLWQSVCRSRCARRRPHLERSALSGRTG